MSNQPSAALRFAISAPQSVISPSINVTCAPSSRHSMMFARGVSRGMKTCASTPARAAYAASAPPALPALGTASLVAPRCFAIETATLIPRALKLCVGLSDSSLIQRSTSSANLAARSSGVPPSPNDTGATSGGKGNTSRYRHNDFSRVARFSRTSVRAAFVKSTLASSGLWHDKQTFCKCDHSCSRPQALHSRWVRNIGAIEAYISTERTRPWVETEVRQPCLTRTASCHLADSRCWQHVGRDRLAVCLPESTACDSC